MSGGGAADWDDMTEAPSIQQNRMKRSSSIDTYTGSGGNTVGSNSANNVTTGVPEEGISFFGSCNSCNPDAMDSNVSRVINARGQGVFGTMAYMAPEIIGQFADSASRSLIEPYTSAVDWYSLGVLAHEFMVGKTPFKLPEGITYRHLRKVYPGILRDCSFDSIQAFTHIFGDRANLNPEEIPPGTTQAIGVDSIELLDGLLSLDPSWRFGAPQDKSELDWNSQIQELSSFAALKDLKFFNGISWKKLNSKTLPPPYIPGAGAIINIPTMRTYTSTEVLKRQKLAHWCEDYDDRNFANDSTPEKPLRSAIVRDTDQEFFSCWHFASSNAVHNELRKITRVPQSNVR